MSKASNLQSLHEAVLAACACYDFHEFSCLEKETIRRGLNVLRVLYFLGSTLDKMKKDDTDMRFLHLSEWINCVDRLGGTGV